MNDALDEIVLNPVDSSRALAGCFSATYRYSLGMLRIEYTVHPEDSKIVIYSICIVRRNLAEFVRKAVESGQLDELMGALGIDRNDFEELPSAPFVN